MESTGASDFTFATRIVVAGGGAVYLVGFSPTTWGTPLNAFAGGDDAFVAKLQNVVVPFITIAGNAGIAGTTLTYSAGAPQQAIADQQGYYTLSVPNGWTGTVTPTLSGCTFTPISRSYSNVVADQPGEDYSPSCNLTNTSTSIAAYDGWILESGEFTNVGGTKNASGTTFLLGDDAANKQYRSILSFNTTLPTGAVVTQITLQIKQSGAPKGSNPFLKLGSIAVDIKKGTFGLASLQLGDFNAKPTAKTAFTITNQPVSGWYSGTFGALADTLINKSGTTQFRLRFTKDDNNNRAANYLKFYSGNCGDANYRPTLIITYSVP